MNACVTKVVCLVIQENGSKSKAKQYPQIGPAIVKSTLSALSACQGLKGLGRK